MSAIGMTTQITFMNCSQKHVRRGTRRGRRMATYDEVDPEVERV